MRPLALVLLAMAALTGGPRVGASQEPTSLQRVEELTRLGRTEEARTLLTAWWETARTDASRRDRQRGLWLRGRLTVDPSQAELDLRRLVVEFPGGAFSDQALLRLAQAAWAEGDGARAQTHLDQLARDYPGSAVAREGRAWRAAAGPPPEPPAGGSGSGGPAAARRDGDTQEPGPEAGRPGNAGPAGTGPEPDETPGPSATSGAFAVQLGAFAGEGRARALRDRLAAAGYEPRLVRVEGSRLLHVRVGRFDDMRRAEELLGEIRRVGLTAALVRDADREERVPR